MEENKTTLEVDEEIVAVEPEVDDDVTIGPDGDEGAEAEAEAKADAAKNSKNQRQVALYAVIIAVVVAAIAVAAFVWMDAQAKQAEADRQFNEAVVEHVTTYEEEYEALKPVYDVEVVDGDAATPEDTEVADETADTTTKVNDAVPAEKNIGVLPVEKAYADEAVGDAEVVDEQPTDQEVAQEVVPDTIEQLADKFVGLQDLRARIEADQDAFKLADGQLYNYDELLGKIDDTNNGIQEHVVETWEAEFAAANIDPNVEGVTEDELNANIAKLEALAAQMEVIAPKIGLNTDDLANTTKQVQQMNAKITEVQQNAAAAKEAQAAKSNTLKEEREAQEAAAAQSSSSSKGNWWDRLDAPDFDPYTELPAWDGSWNLNENWNHTPSSGDWFYNIGTGEWIRIQ